MNSTAILGAAYDVNDAGYSKNAKLQEVTCMVSNVMKNALAEQQPGETLLSNANLVIGSYFGRLEFISKGGEQAARLGLRDYCNPNYFVHSISSAVAGQAAIDHKIGKETIMVNTGELSGIDAIGYAHSAALGSDELYFAGGADGGYAIAASGKFEGAENIKSAAGIITLCNAAAHQKQAIGYITNYTTLLAGAWQSILAPVLHDLQQAARPVVLVTCGCMSVDQGSLAACISAEKHIGVTGGAGGAVALAMLLSGQLLQNLPRPATIIIAGASKGGKYSHLIVEML